MRRAWKWGALILWLAHWPATAAEDDVAKARVLVFQSVAQYQKWIAARGSAELKQVASSTRVDVVDYVVPNAGVAKGSNGVLAMVISPYLYLVYSYISEVGIFAAQDAKWANCWTAYDEYIFSVYARNSRSMATDARLVAVDPPELFSIRYGGPCAGIEKKYPTDLTIRPARDAAVFYALFMTYLHELGHVALGHVSIVARPPGSGPADAATEKKQLADLRRSRDQEYAADRWAINQAVAIGIPVQYLITPSQFLLWVASTGIDCFNKLQFTHPPGVERAKKAVQQIRTAYAQAGKTLPIVVDDLYADLIVFSDKVEKKLECPAS